MSVKSWIYRDAKWWQFWRPQSGVRGGFLLVVVAFAVIKVLVLVVL
jgi:hypothetical protein